MKRLKCQSGFTLIEVAIAMAILAGAFIGLYAAQTQSVSNSAKTKQFNFAAMLLQQKMTESELLIRGKQFSDVKKEESGQFAAPYEDYAWKREVREIEFPNMVGPPDGGQGGASSAAANGGGGTDQSADMMGRLVTKFLSNALREVSVTVSWKRGKNDIKETVTTYWVDLNHEFALSE